jgi:predicted MFS family arabinose efflux permease
MTNKMRTATRLPAYFDAFRGLSLEIWLLALVSLINRTGSMVVCYLALYLTESVGFSLRDVGYITAFFGLGSVAGAYLGGVLTDLLGFYRVQWFSLLSSGFLLLVAKQATQFLELCLIFFAFALVSEAFRPANSVAIRQMSKPEVRTRSFSLMRVSVNLAMGLALVVGGFLVSLGWNWLFWVDALTCWAAAIVVFLYLKPKPELETQAAKVDTQNSTLKTGKSAYRDSQFLFFSVLTFLGATVFMQFLWVIPLFFKREYGWSEFNIGLASSLNCVLVMLIEMPLIFRIEKRKTSLKWVNYGIICYALAYLSLMFPAQLAILAAVSYMTIISFGEIFVMPFSSNWATQRASEARQGEYMALYTLCYSVANVVAPLVGTQVADVYGFRTLWLGSAAVCALVWVGFWFLDSQEEKKKIFR